MHVREKESERCEVRVVVLKILSAVGDSVSNSAVLDRIEEWVCVCLSD